jgi:hypothetical protein
LFRNPEEGQGSQRAVMPVTMMTMMMMMMILLVFNVKDVVSKIDIITEIKN